MMQPVVHSFFDPVTCTVTHVVADPQTGKAAIIDSVLDYEPHGGRVTHESADKVIALIRAEGYTVQYILETHAHADHLTAAQYLKQQLGGAVGIGERVREVQEVMKVAFAEGDDFASDGSQFDHLWKDGEVFAVGGIPAQVIAVPGHTPADVAYLIGDALFVGDTIFMPDYGTARCDFPGGDASMLYTSVQRLYTLPDDTRMFLCHDYLPAGRHDYQWETTVGEQKDANIHVGLKVDKTAFVAQRTARDATLGMPKLIIPALQVNMRAGAFPPPAANGILYLKIPVNGAFAQ